MQCYDSISYGSLGEVRLQSVIWYTTTGVGEVRLQSVIWYMTTGVELILNNITKRNSVFSNVII